MRIPAYLPAKLVENAVRFLLSLRDLKVSMICLEDDPPPPPPLSLESTRTRSRLSPPARGALELCEINSNSFAQMVHF